MIQYDSSVVNTAALKQESKGSFQSEIDILVSSKSAHTSSHYAQSVPFNTQPKLDCSHTIHMRDGKGHQKRAQQLRTSMLARLVGLDSKVSRLPAVFCSLGQRVCVCVCVCVCGVLLKKNGS